MSEFWYRMAQLSFDFGVLLILWFYGRINKSQNRMHKTQNDINEKIYASLDTVTEVSGSMRRIIERGYITLPSGERVYFRQRKGGDL